MRTPTILRVMAAGAMILVANAALFIGIASAEIAWQEDLRTAHAQASAEGKLLLLHFYSDNCVWCERLEAGALKAPEVGATMQESFVPVKIHGGKNPKLTQMFNVKAFPTDVVVSIDGKMLSHSVSPQKAEDYLAMLRKIPQPSASPASDTPAAGYAASNAASNIAAGDELPDYARSPVSAAAANQNPATPGADTMAALSLPASPTVTSPAPMHSAGLELPSGTPGLLAGARSAGKPIDPPRSFDLPASESQSLTDHTSVTDEPELAMQGYCAVTVIREDRWVEGNPKFGVVHLGKLYLFASDESMQTFLADPIPFTPVLNEIDVVRFFEERKIVPGKREWGLKDPTHNRMFFFADEAAMNHFWNEYKRYTGPAIEVMERAIRDAHPGT